MLKLGRSIFLFHINRNNRKIGRMGNCFGKEKKNASPEKVEPEKEMKTSTEVISEKVVSQGKKEVVKQLTEEDIRSKF